MILANLRETKPFFFLWGGGGGGGAAPCPHPLLKKTDGIVDVLTRRYCNICMKCLAIVYLYLIDVCGSIFMSTVLQIISKCVHNAVMNIVNPCVCMHVYMYHTLCVLVVGYYCGSCVQVCIHNLRWHASGGYAYFYCLLVGVMGMSGRGGEGGRGQRAGVLSKKVVFFFFFFF